MAGWSLDARRGRQLPMVTRNLSTMALMPAWLTSCDLGCTGHIIILPFRFGKVLQLTSPIRSARAILRGREKQNKPMDLHLHLHPHPHPHLHPHRHRYRRGNGGTFMLSERCAKTMIGLPMIVLSLPPRQSEIYS